MQRRLASLERMKRPLIVSFIEAQAYDAVRASIEEYGEALNLSGDHADQTQGGGLGFGCG
jgi:hypothetical protein